MSRRRRVDRSPAARAATPQPARRASRGARRRRYLLPAALIALALTGFLVLRFVVPALRAPAIPDPVSADMQAPVARVLAAARKGVVDQPRSAAAWGRFGAACDAHRLFDEASICYRRAHELDPKDFAWPYLLAVVQDFRGVEPAEVTAQFEEALRLNPNYPPAVLRFGDALVRQGKNPQARIAYGRALELDPNFAMAHRGMGQVLLALGDAQTAIQHLERAAELSPGDGTVFTALARGYRMLGDEGRAEEAAQRAAGLEPDHSVPDPVRYDVEAVAVSSVACIRRFQEAMQARSYAQAIPDLKLLVEMFPAAATYHHSLGTCYQETGQHDLALVHLAKAVELDEKMVEPRRRLAAELMAQGKAADAVEHLRAALALEPDRPDILIKLGLALGMSGDLDAAIEEFRRASALVPANPEVHHDLGTALMRRGDWTQAAEELRLALKFDPASADTHYNLGLVLEKLGRTAEALAQHRRAVELRADHAAAQRLAALEGQPPR